MGRCAAVHRRGNSRVAGEAQTQRTAVEDIPVVYGQSKQQLLYVSILLNQECIDIFGDRVVGRLVQVKAEYASVADFVKISVLERTSKVNGGKLLS